MSNSDSLNRGIEALNDCEKRLRSLIGEASGSGDYDAVVQLTDWAKGVGQIKSSRAEDAAKTPVRNLQSAQQGSAASVSRKTAKRKTSSKKRGKKKSKYPRFVRMRDELIKIGWSKREKREYRHKAPRAVVDALVERLLEVGASGNLFTTDELFPLMDRQGNEAIPAYQGYLALAWLRQEKLIEQQGRQGYRILNPEELQKVVEEYWKRLSVQR